MSDNAKVPAVAGETPRAIVGEQLKCVDGRWTCGGADLPSGRKYLVVKWQELLQRWENERVIDTKDPAEYNVDDLNDQTDQETWEDDVAGTPRPPWQHTYFTYLFDPENADRFTFASATVGARIAYEDLTEKIRWMSRIKGAPVIPQVALSSKLMKTRFGTKMRPHFQCLSWVGGGGEGLIASQPAPSLEGPQKAVAAEPAKFDDSIPF